VLECVEIKKLVVFPGCCLGQQESALVESAAAAMLRCWRVLVSLKRLDGFDSVLASMERQVAASEQIPWTLRTETGAWPDGVNITARFSLILPDGCIRIVFWSCYDVIGLSYCGNPVNLNMFGLFCNAKLGPGLALNSKK
jgi:hypothetical protein